MYIILSLFAVVAIIALWTESMPYESQRKQLIIPCLILMAIVSGTRLCGGLDFPTYEGHYRQLATFPNVLNPAYVNKNYEIGYTYFAAFFKTLGVSFYGFCVIHAMVFYTCLWKGISRYTDHFGIVLLIFLYKLFFYDTMISMRQSLTIAFFFLMLPMIEQKQWIRYYLCAFVASKFHNGAYLLFLLYPLAYISITKKRILWLNIIFIPTMFIGFLGIDILGPIGHFLADNATSGMMADKAQKYFNNENLSPIGIFHTVEYFIIMFMVYKKLDEFDLEDPAVHTVMAMFLCLLPLFTLLRGSEILTREKDYFVIFYAVVLGYVMDISQSWKSYIKMFVILLCTFGYYRYVLLFDNGAFLRYESWLFTDSYSYSFFRD